MDKIKTYIIGYDKKAGQDYAPLLEVIKEIGIGWRHLDSTWIVRSSLSAKQILSIIKPHLDPKNKVLVARITNDADWLGFNERGSNWLKKCLCE